jgi:hypothetical protein
MVRNVSKRERANVESLPANVELCNTELLMRHMLRTTRNVLFGFRQMSELHAAINAPSSALVGSGIGLSASDA